MGTAPYSLVRGCLADTCGPVTGSVVQRTEMHAQRQPFNVHLPASVSVSPLSTWAASLPKVRTGRGHAHLCSQRWESTERAPNSCRWASSSHLTGLRQKSGVHTNQRDLRGLLQCTCLAGQPRRRNERVRENQVGRIWTLEPPSRPAVGCSPSGGPISNVHITIHNSNKITIMK